MTDSARPSLHSMLAGGQGGALLLGLTPPRRSTTPARAQEIADLTRARLDRLDLDGIILYDIDDESDRNPDERPFPYLPTMDPASFHGKHLTRLGLPAVVYRCVGKYPEDELGAWLRAADPERVASVFVGPSTGDKRVHTKLARAHELRAEVRPELLVGAVTITERYSRRGDEHLRMIAKQGRGVDYFVSQVVYDVDGTRSMLSDYAYACAERGLDPRPVLLTLSVCGSAKTLEFLHWLGVDVPRWVENDLRHTSDPLAVSLEHCVASARSLAGFCRRLGLPFGFNVESVTSRAAEIGASMELAEHLRGVLDQP